MDPKLVLKIVIFLSFLNSYSIDSVNYYFDSNYSGETKSGLSKKSPFKNLKKIRTIILNPGDSIFLANGSYFQGNIKLKNKSDIYITNYGSNQKPLPIIDSKGHIAGIFIETLRIFPLLI